MRTNERVFENVVPEHIIDCEFEEMMFTNEMLEIYFSIDGKRSLAEIQRKLSINPTEVISNISRMAQSGIVRVKKKESNPPKSKVKKKFCYRGVECYL